MATKKLKPLQDPKVLRALVTLSSLAFIIVGTLLAVQLAKGYQLSRNGSILAGTGILNVNSSPKNSLIYINGVLQDKVTDEQINLEPGEYELQIKQEGFSSWSKNMRIEKELVTSANAQLFRSVPTLTPQTFSGALNITPSPDGRKIAYAVASPSAQIKAGLYVMELSDRPEIFSRNARLVAENSARADFKKASLLWSPDSSQIVAHFDNINLLLYPQDTLKPVEIIDATSQIQVLLPSWEQEIADREKRLLLDLPSQMFEIVTASATNLYFSPDGSRLLYTATAEVTIPENLITPLPASSTQAQQRSLNPGNLYVYDLKEDRNFRVADNINENQTAPEKTKLITDLSQSSLFTTTPATESASLLEAETLPETINNFRAQYSSFPAHSYQWFPTSNHIIFNTSGVVSVVEYDGTNHTTIYQGAFQDNFIYPWPDGSRLLILANLTNNPQIPANLYTINLR